MSQKKFFSTTSNLHGRYWIWACMKLNFSFVHFRLWNYLLTYYLLYSSKFLKISVKRFQVFYIKYIICLRVFSTGKSLRINYYTAEKAKSVDCIKSVSCLFDKVAQVRSRSSVVLKRMFSQIFRNLQKSPFVRVPSLKGLWPTTLFKRDSDTGVFLSVLRHFQVQLFPRAHIFVSGFSFKNIHDSQTFGAFPLTPLYHLHPLHRHIDITCAIITEISAWLWPGIFDFQA